jgi:hypothetical protein
MLRKRGAMMTISLSSYRAVTFVTLWALQLIKECIDLKPVRQRVPLDCFFYIKQ